LTGSTDIVARQYEAYRYPRPIDDLAAAVAAGGVDQADPLHFHLRYWPDRPYRPDMRILVAGCGTNQAAHIAFTNPRAQVLGIDLSQASLQHQKFLQEKHGIANLRLRQLDILRAGEIGETFDLIVSTGVLHHLPDPDAGLRALAPLLAPDGAFHIMLYGRYARVGVYMMQELFRRLGVGQSADDVAFARATLAALPPEHYLNWHRKRSGDLEHDSGLVDTLLHPVDRAYTPDEVIAFAETNGLVFQNWADNRLYYPDARVPAGHPLAQRIASLPERAQWACVDLFVQDTMLHSAVFCRKEKDPASYRVTWDGPHALDYVPFWNVGVETLDQLGTPGPATLKRLDDSFQLGAEIVPLLARLDGKRTIGQCVEGWNFPGSPGQRAGLAVGLFATLWRRSLMQVRIPARR
jgi:SAM-dependent methyltransferase